MPIIEEVTSRNQQPMGRFKARADQAKFGSFFCRIEGDTDGRWEDVRDVTTSGVQIGRGQSGRLQLTEFRDEHGKTNDINYNGIKLRECVAPIAEIREKNKREAALSTEDCRDFLSKEDLAQRSQLNGMLSVSGKIETDNQTIDRVAEQLPPGEAIPRRGRPPKTQT